MYLCLRPTMSAASSGADAPSEQDTLDNKASNDWEACRPAIPGKRATSKDPRRDQVEVKSASTRSTWWERKPAHRASGSWRRYRDDGGV